MAADREDRRLAAILSADMVGYSRLMEADEQGTVGRQKTHRNDVIDPMVSDHKGRIVKTTGDGLLVEFASVVDATECAVAIQRAIVAREADIPDESRIQYRMGINLGDIIVDGDDILGDGVNVADRLEGLAEPGGICISGMVLEGVRNKLDYESRIWASKASRTSRGRFRSIEYGSTVEIGRETWQLLQRDSWRYRTSRQSQSFPSTT